VVLRPLSDEQRKMVATLRTLKEGQRVRYKGWRGDTGYGVFLGFIDMMGGTRRPVAAKEWGKTKSDALLIKRDFSADDGRLFLPFAGDGDEVTAALDEKAGP